MLADDYIRCLEVKHDLVPSRLLVTARDVWKNGNKLILLMRTMIAAMVEHFEARPNCAGKQFMSCEGVAWV